MQKPRAYSGLRRKKGLPARLASKIENIEDKTKEFDGICVNLCINYGGQYEIVQAAKTVVADNKELNIENISQYLYNSFIPRPDLIIRTGGQTRLSNFLTYQSAYAELFFTKTLWPDFSSAEYYSIVDEYKRRTRSFGGIVDD